MDIVGQNKQHYQNDITRRKHIASSSSISPLLTSDNHDIEMSNENDKNNYDSTGATINNDNNHTDDDDEDNKKKGFKNFGLVPIMVLVWYITAIGSITTSKKVMNLVPFPFMLCTAQFGIASVITSFISKYTMSRKFMEKGLTLLQPQAQQIVYRIAISYTFGFIFTNIAFSIVTASFAETVKSAEPLSSVFLGYFFYREGTSIHTYLSLIPICTGVAISCIDDLSFSLYGFLAAAASNFCFSGRAVLTKHLFRKFPNCIDEISMFAQISKVGLIILIPFMILLESRMIISLLYNESYKVTEMLILLIINGCAYSTYNISSFLVLSRTNLLTHAVFNCFRRVFIILFTCYYFQVALSPMNITGVGVAVIGVIFFAYSKNKDSK